MRIAVLISGTGSILKHMIDTGVPIELVVADRECPGTQHGVDAKIETLGIFRGRGPDFDRDRYTRTLIAILNNREIDLVVMAGFMTILAPVMFEADTYGGKVLNTHPSLLPAFKGDHAVRDALAYGAKITGCTVHYATTELDAGPIIDQGAVHILLGDTVETLHERLKGIERDLYTNIVLRMVTNARTTEHVQV